MDIFWGIVLGVGILLALVVLVKGFGSATEENMKQKDHIEKVKADIQALPNALDKTFQYEVDKMLGINKLENFILVYDFLKEPKYRKIDFKNIIDTKINVDGVTVTSSSTGGVLGRALVGGILAGGTGVVIGGLSGSKTSEQKIQKLELEILLNDLDKPSIAIPFFQSITPADVKVDKKLQEAQNEIDEWSKIFKVILYQNNHMSNNKDVMK